MTRDSDADFGKTLRHGRGLLGILVAVVVATASVIGAAYGLAQGAADERARLVFGSEENRERMEHVAEGVVDRKVTRPLTALEVEVRQLREVLQRVEANTRPAPPEKRR